MAVLTAQQFKTAGYAGIDQHSYYLQEAINAAIVLPGDLEVVAVDDKIQDTDYWYLLSIGWTPVPKHHVGTTIMSVSPYVVRKRAGIFTNLHNNKWTCGHGRSTSDLFCVICNVLYYKRVTK